MMSEGEDINLLQEEEEIKFAEDPQFEEAPDDPDDIEFKEEEKVKDLSIKTEEDDEIIDTSEGQKSRPKNRSKDDATNFYCCNLCGYKDCEKYRVRYHLNRIHKELKDHCKILRVGCKECEKGNNCCVDQKQEKKMKNKLKCLKESCNFSAGSKLRLRRHIERLHKELLDYACNNCDFRTYNERSLFQHTLMTHNDAQDFSYGCHECGKSFKVKRSLDNHLENIHGSRKRFYCSDCEFPSYSKYSVKDHQKNVHPENENCKILKIGCEDCENGDNSCVDEDKRRKRETHQNVMKMEVDSNGEYICNLCQTKTKTKANAQAHIEMVHENKFNFKCSECNYQSYYGPSIKRHQMRKHVNILCQIIKVICEACNKGEDHKDCKRIKDPENISHVSFNKGNEFKCSLCDYQTDKYQNVAFHLQSLKHQGVEGKVLTLGCQDCEEDKDHPCFQKGKQAEKSLKSNFACELCGLKSNSQVAKVAHYKEQHPGESIYKCDQCVYGSNYLQNLKMHVDSHHNMTELICNLCDYVTKWNTLFHSHMREKHNVIKKNVKKTATATETGENNSKYLCDQCDFSTKSKQYLKMHVNSKHNGLALKCDMCDHTSTSNSNLKKHRDMKHFGKTYNCNVCDYKSKSNQYLTVHLKTHDPVA